MVQVSFEVARVPSRSYGVKTHLALQKLQGWTTDLHGQVETASMIK